VGIVGFSVVGDAVEVLLDSMLNAIDSFFYGDSSGADIAAVMRVGQRGQALDDMSSDFFTGVGFKVFWVDFPLLQAFSNLGVFFGLLYGVVYLLYPLFMSVVLFSGRESVAVFFSLLYVCSVPRLFLHGQPLDWQHMIYVVPVLCYFSSYFKVTRV